MKYVYTFSGDGVVAWQVLEEDPDAYYCLREAIPTMLNGLVHRLPKTGKLKVFGSAKEAWQILWAIDPGRIRHCEWHCFGNMEVE